MGRRDVAPADRFRVHRWITDAQRANGARMDTGTRVLVAATYWESFPGAYSAEQVDAAQRLHVFAQGSPEWEQAWRDVARLAGIRVPSLERDPAR